MYTRVHMQVVDNCRLCVYIVECVNFGSDKTLQKRCNMQTAGCFRDRLDHGSEEERNLNRAVRRFCQDEMYSPPVQTLVVSTKAYKKATVYGLVIC